MLIEMGKWLEINGEGIYSSRPWATFGEGPTRIRSGGHKVEKQKISYTEDDIRFTKKGDNILYAFVLDQPTKDINIKSFGTEMTMLDGPITSVKILGSDEEVIWKQTSEGLKIKKPSSLPSKIAITYKVEIKTSNEIGIGGEEQ